MNEPDGKSSGEGKNQHNFHRLGSKFSELIDVMDIAVWELDLEYRIVAHNKKASELYGDTIAGKPCYQVAAKLSSVCPDCPARMVLEGHNSGRAEHKRINASGQEIYIDHLATPMLDKQGKLTGVLVLIIDITKHKQMEKELEQARRELEALVSKQMKQIDDSDALWHVLMENLPVGVIIVDPDTRIIEEVNQSTIQLFGAPKERIVGHICHDYICPASRGACPICDLGQEVDNSEKQILTNDGGHLPVIKSVKRIRIQGRDKLLECFLDISERKKTDEKIRKLSQLKEDLISYGSLTEKLQRATDGVVDILGADFSRIWLVRKGDICDSCRHAKMKDEGYACRDRNNCLHLVASSGRYRQIDGRHQRVPIGCYKIGRVASSEEPGFLTNDVIKDPQVHDHDWARRLSLTSFAGYKLQTSKKKPIGVLALFSRKELSKSDTSMLQAIANSVSELILLNTYVDALQDSEEKYRSMMEALDDPAYICSSSYRITYMNPAMTKIIGRDAIGSVCHKTIHGLVEKCPWCFHDTVMSGNSIKTEVISPKDNKIYRVSASPIFHPGGSVSMMAVFHDITDLKKIETRLQQAQKMEAIGTLAGGIAHDFNNILFPIMGHTEMLLTQIPQDSPYKDSLNAIFYSAARAKDLVKQILTFSRQESSEFKLIKIQPIVREALKLIRSTIPATIHIRQKINEDCGAIKADPTQIHQIIMNLATNAYHAMEKTGGELKVKLEEVNLDALELTYQDMEPGVYIHLSVADNGVGMDQNVIKKIFEPFFTTKGKDKGTGMGLSVVHGIVRSAGGSIHVYSEPGNGSEFHIYLPVVKHFPQKAEALIDEYIRGGDETVLLVDDEDTVITIETQMLERLGYKVISRLSSVEALEAFRAVPGRFDLVITDMAMPGMSGDQLAAELKKIRSDIDIVLCTGFSETMSEEKAVSLGIRGFLLKPIVMKDLARTVRMVLDASRQN